MHIDINPGTYVVAVSGGVDSMVLLDLLVGLRKLKLVVAHLDHGIRQTSENDRILVQKTAAKYGLPFVYDRVNLGSGASEAKAREARYRFLNKVKKASSADAIITAHHQDDLIETAIINMMRGTGRRGLSALQSRTDVLRPLLNYPKSDLIKYARDHKIDWHEDSTNRDEMYLRNYIRHSIMPKFSREQKNQMLKHISKLTELNKEIDHAIDQQIKGQNKLDRHWFIMLNHKVALDVMATWLKEHNAKDVNRKMVEILVQAAKTYPPGKKAAVDKRLFLDVGKEYLALSLRER
jgi:tRNA(Ile)-lysidine synthase